MRSELKLFKSLWKLLKSLWKVIVVATIIIICIAAIVRIHITLENYQDLIVFQADEPLSLSSKKVVCNYLSYNRHVRYICVYDRKDNAPVTSGTKSENISLYIADNAIFNFPIFDITYGLRRGSSATKYGDINVIIDSNTALKLYGRENCVGEKISINKAELEITGICKRPDSLLEVVSATDNGALYIIGNDLPDTVQGLLPLPDETTIIFKVAQGTSTIIDETIEKDIRVISDITHSSKYKVDNIDFEARLSIMLIKVIYLLLLLLAAYAAGICIMKIFKRLKKRIESEFSSLYFKEVIKNNAVKIAGFFVLLLIYISSILLLLKVIDFKLVLPPEIIPPRLIDINIFTSKLRDWAADRNKKYYALSSMGFYAINSRAIIMICGFAISVIAAYFTAKYKRERGVSAK